MTTRVAVVGAGMAGARFARRVLGGPQAVSVAVYGDEPQAPYSRVLLAEVLTGRHTPDGIALPGLGSAELRRGCEVVAVDPAAGVLLLEDGTSDGFDVAVFATGSIPVLPPIRNLHRTSNTGEGGELKDGVHAFRTLEDCARLRGQLDAGASRAVVVGGGILGVSAARALAELGLPVEIVHQAPHLMERHLDAGAASALAATLRAHGVEVYTDNRAKAVRGRARVDGVQLANGHVLDADVLVLACGTRPRTGLARTAGLQLGPRGGIVVDDALATSVPGVYAIGDCTEHRGVVRGLAGAAWDQADVLAGRLSGSAPDAVYTGSVSITRLTAGPVEVAAFGDLSAPETSTDEVRVSDATRRTYKRLALRGDRIVGAVLVGDLASVGALTRAYERGDPLPRDPLSLLTAPAGTPRPDSAVAGPTDLARSHA